MTLRLIESTLDGPRKFTVEGRPFAVPESAVVRLAQRGRVVYVVSDERLHVFVKGGEVTGLPDELSAAARAFYFDNGRKVAS